GVEGIPARDRPDAGGHAGENPMPAMPERRDVGPPAGPVRSGPETGPVPGRGQGGHAPVPEGPHGLPPGQDLRGGHPMSTAIGFREYVRVRVTAPDGIVQPVLLTGRLARKDRGWAERSVRAIGEALERCGDRGEIDVTFEFRSPSSHELDLIGFD